MGLVKSTQQEREIKRNANEFFIIDILKMIFLDFECTMIVSLVNDSTLKICAYELSTQLVKHTHLNREYSPQRVARGESAIPATPGNMPQPE